MLEIKALRAGYPGKTVLDGLDAAIPPGQVTVIVGPNGCGKSTLLKTLCGILPIAGGEILLDGKPLAAFSQGELAKNVAYLSQSRAVPDITAERLVLHGRFPYLRYPRRYRPADMAIANAAMARMGVAELAGTPVANLSGGQRQKVYIAMALAQDTPWVLLDEPTAYLDISHQLQMAQQAHFLAESGKTVVMVLHDLPLALKTAEHMVVMDAGRVIRAGTPREIWESGCLKDVFGVEVGRIRTEKGWRYFIDA